MNFKHTDTTRYLCATAYLNKQFCDSFIKEILEENYKAIGIAYGVDLATVIKHYLAAKKKRLKRDILLAILTIIFSCFSYINNILAVFIVYFLAWMIMYWYKWTTYYDILAQQLSKKNFRDSLPDYKPTSRMQAKLEKLTINQNGNVIVYGGFSPFVGSGINVGGWSFTLNLSHPKEENLIPKEFHIEELYDFIDNDITKLDLHGLEIEDKLCVNGQAIRENKAFLPNIFMQPISQVEPKFMKKYIRSNKEHIRYYKHFKVVTWNGQMIFSVFLRLLKLRNKLFVEASYFLLTPVHKWYQKVDTLTTEIGYAKAFNILLESFFEPIIMMPLSLASLLNLSIEPRLSRRTDLDMKVLETIDFNYGSTTSIRESISSPDFNQYFQKLDQEMYLKLIERQIIDSLWKFLDNKNIDTFDLKERKTAIFNNGVILSGDSINATNLSVGQNAKAAVNSIFKGSDLSKQ